MATSVIEVLESLTAKIAALEEEQSVRKQRLKELEEENAQLKARLIEQEHTIGLQNLDIEYLKISHKLADSPDNIRLARQLIARLIRNIDTCIASLKEEG